MENLGISILENLGNPMNTMKNAMNAKNILGESKNSQNRLGMNKHKPRGKGRRRFNSARSPLPKDRGLRRMILWFIEMGHWRLFPPSLKPSNPTSTMGYS